MAARISVSARLSLVYLLFSICWIFLTGALAERLAAGDAGQLRLIEQYKGLVFVAGSTLFLYFLSRGYYRQILHALDEHRVLLKKNSAIGIATKEGIYEYDLKNNRVVFNDNMKKILGATEPKVEEARAYWVEHLHPDDRSRVLFHFENARKTGTSYWIDEYRFLTGENVYRDLLHSVYIVRDNDGKPQSVIGAIQDLTGMRELERDYQQQEIRKKIEIANSIIEAEEKERNRWAEELHDNIAQVLSVANLYTGLLRQPGVDIHNTADKIKEMIELSVTEIRQLSAHLKPPRFEEQNLKESISALVYYIKQVKDIRFTIQVEPQTESRLTEDHKLMVYRIIQEQLNNITKYADAGHVLIIVTVDYESASVLIKDDGVGFDEKNFKEGTGLRNMRSRLELFRGDLLITSPDGVGCELRATFRM